MAAAAAAPESYIGSVISLTSKSEIRYEGVLYTINTEESSIGLRNVRSFGTEGRKKDGQQILVSDKIYEYILFRGSDIKDLQVKSSPPAQAATLHNDPAIIQSHYPRPASLPTSLSSAPSTTVADPTPSHNVPSGIQMPPPFQGNLPPYQPGASLPSWNSSPMPSSANGTGLAMPPMYWPGYYTPPGGFPHLQPPPFLRPPHGLTVPQALQPPVQYPGLNGPLPAGFPNMPELPSFLQPGNNNNSNNNLLQSSGLSASISMPTSSSTPAIESLGSQLPNKLPSSLSAVVSMGLTTPSSVESKPLSQGMPTNNMNKPVAVPDSSLPSMSSEKPVGASPSIPTYLPPSQAASANVAPVTVAEPVTLVTPDQLLPATSSAGALSHTLQTSAVVPSSKTASSTVSSSQAISSTVPSPQATSSVVPSVQATSSMVLSSQAASTSVPSSQASTSVLSSSENASSSVPRKQLDVRGENKGTKQREWKAKQSPVAQSNKEPLLPAPKQVPQKPVEPSSFVQYNNRGHAQYNNRGHAQYNRGHAQYNNRGRGRGRGGGRGNGQSHPITKFTEDFDFTAMNEKFNKDEVWGHLGRSNGQFDDYSNDYEDNVLEDDEISPSKPDAKAVYVKDDFFDSLSCNTTDNGGRSGRVKFSEQRKIDTETFGDSARHRPMGMRGGRGPRGGGPRGRGYYGRGYGYTGRGRGYSYPNHQS